MEKLSPKAKEVMHNKGTEAPFSGKLLRNKEAGIYACANCNSGIFSSDAKFDSGTGWPSFDRPENNNLVELRKDVDGTMDRTEVICAKCKVHLGHVFPDGPTETGNRYCINSVALSFNKELKDNKN